MLCRPIIFSILVVSLASSVCWGNEPFHAWSERHGYIFDDNAVATAVDSWGDLYVTGNFHDSLLIGGNMLVGESSLDIYLAKLDPAGAVIWAKSFAGTFHDYPGCMDVDRFGYVAITGYFSGSIEFGGGILTSAGSSDVFVAKFAPDGSHVMSVRLGGAFSDFGHGLAMDDAGNTYVTGMFYDTVNFGGGPLTSAGDYDIYIVKLGIFGQHVWSKRFGGTLTDQGIAVDIESNGDLLLAAYASSPIDFGGGSLPNAGSTDVYLAKFDSTGTHQWSRSCGGSDTDLVLGMTIDSSDNVVITGYFRGSANFGGASLISDGIYDVFLAKYDPSGSHLWSLRAGGSQDDYGHAVAVDEADNVLITGSFYGSADFGGSPLISGGESDVFVAGYSSGGEHQWSSSFGALGYDRGEGISVDPSGSLILFGEFSPMISLGGEPLYSLGSVGYRDLFLAKFYTGPSIYSILDIPGDQGGMVNITWDANSGDNEYDRAISSYSVWRAIDAGAASSMLKAGAELASGMLDISSDASHKPLLRQADDYYWYMIETVTAIGLEHYSAPVQTLFDSTSVSQQNHYFQVIAHTLDPYVYYPSDPDSGYSVDNLAPAAPQSPTARQQINPDGLQLIWRANREADLAHYEVYRGTYPDFSVDGGSFLIETADTSAFDSEWRWDSNYWYKVSAVDLHENMSTSAIIGPDMVSGAGGEIFRTSRLEQNAPNPFNPVTTIRFTVAKPGIATMRIYNTSGELIRTLLNEFVEAKEHSITWNGRSDSGTPVASGVYFYKLSFGIFSQTKKMVLLK